MRKYLILIIVLILLITIYALMRLRITTPEDRGALPKFIPYAYAIEITPNPLEDRIPELNPLRYVTEIPAAPSITPTTSSAPSTLSAPTASDAKPALPSGCSDPTTCETYCRTHPQECVAFAKAHGYLNEEDATRAQQFATLIAQWKTPGGCTTESACESYCLAEGHMEECIAFALKSGLANAEEIARWRATGGKGPGGCNGRAQCESYCNDPAHTDECMAWAEAHGLTERADIARMKDSVSTFRAQLQNLPAEITSCMKERVGETAFARMQAGEPVFAQNLHTTLAPCFAGYVVGPEDPRNPQGQMLPQGSNEQWSQQGTTRGSRIIIPLGERLPFEQFPEAVLTCINETLGAHVATALRAGTLRMTEETGWKINACFQKFTVGAPSVP